MLEVAIAEARIGLDEGGIPVGAAIFDGNGKVIGTGRNRRVQSGDPSLHGETDAFRRAGRQRSYRDLIMVTTLAPCWYCSGLVRQFGFNTLPVQNFELQGGVVHSQAEALTLTKFQLGSFVLVAFDKEQNHAKADATRVESHPDAQGR